MAGDSITASVGQVLPLAQLLLLASGPEDPHRNLADCLTTSPQRWFRPGQLPGGKRPVKMTNYFVLTKTMFLHAEVGPVATQDHHQALLQHYAEARSSPTSCRLTFIALPMLGSRLLALPCPQLGWETHEDPSSSPLPISPSLVFTATLPPSGNHRAQTRKNPPPPGAHPTQSCCLAGGEAFRGCFLTDNLAGTWEQ